MNVITKAAQGHNLLKKTSGFIGNQLMDYSKSQSIDPDLIAEAVENALFNVFDEFVMIAECPAIDALDLQTIYEIEDTIELAQNI